MASWCEGIISTRLPADARHVERVLRRRECAVAVDPEEAAVDRPLVRRPRRRERADELHVALRQDALAVPHAVLQIEVREARPVAARAELVAVREEVPVRIGVQHHRADADLVEQRALRERVVVLLALLDREADQVVGEHRIGVAVAADRVRRPLLRTRRRILEGVHAARVQVEVIGVRTALRRSPDPAAR